MTTDFAAKARPIKLLVSDVDGVLTEGHLIYNEAGIAYKMFHAHDGVGLQLLRAIGIEIAIITTCQSPIVKMRGEQLGLTHVYQGIYDKGTAFADLLDKTGFAPEQVAAIGDDIPDMPMLVGSGLGVAVANGVPELKAVADYVTTQRGGHGAVRELCDAILQAQGKREQAIEAFTRR
jgi:3-deoxy-D-manno-octulosonate 8-phosphate phosphatase (KDO 8-P phosphatase)